MAVYIGFNTTNLCVEEQNLSNSLTGGLDVTTPKKRSGKKFRLTDTNLVVTDLINALNIKRGDKVGKPDYGTTLWDLLFDPNTNQLRAQVENEIKRVISLDPRIELITIEVYSRENGILVEMEVLINPFTDIVQIGVLLDTTTGTVTQVL